MYADACCIEGDTIYHGWARESESSGTERRIRPQRKRLEGHRLNDNSHCDSNITACTGERFTQVAAALQDQLCEVGVSHSEV